MEWVKIKLDRPLIILDHVSFTAGVPGRRQLQREPLTKGLLEKLVKKKSRRRVVAFNGGFNYMKKKNHLFIKGTALFLEMRFVQEGRFLQQIEEIKIKA